MLRDTAFVTAGGAYAGGGQAKGPREVSRGPFTS